MTTPFRRWLAFALFALALGSASASEAQNLTGTWELQMFVEHTAGGTRGDIGSTCSFEGTADIVDTGGALSGSASMGLTLGDRSCPTTLTGTLTGTLDGTSIEMGMLSDGGGGTATFEGELGVTRGSVPDPASGTLNVTGGLFAGAIGAWNAQLVTSPAVSDIPTVGVAGLTALTLFLLLAGFVVLRR